jgi:hypothetical protein
MKLAIMQPYIFPYIGYIQLIAAVDKFVVYDDVTFIKQGWINRNNILLNNKPFLFTIPLVNASSNSLIYNTLLDSRQAWKNKLLKTFQQAYRKAPYFSPVYELVERVIMADAETISELATESLLTVVSYLGILTQIQVTSRNYDNQNLTAQDRVLDICRLEQASHYINPIGGQQLYSKSDFLARGIRLDFIKSLDIKYNQFSDPFVPWLSIVDVLMFNSPERTRELIMNYNFA